MSTADLNENREQLELLAGYVLGDLNEEESERLETILSNNETRQLLWELERTAATVQVVSPAAEESMPDHVADRIRESARALLQSDQRNTPVAEGPRVEVAKPTAAPLRELVAWFCAAACLIFAFSVAQPYESETSLAQSRSKLLATPDVVLVDWAAAKTPFDAPVEGDVVWDNDSQTGFMRFVDMPVNDPTVEQYQLWIIDPDRDDEPIDGGVFDITESGEVLVEINAKLAVINPAAFAITIEKPGGVVVSTQDRLPLIAAVEG
ncbi:MAG: anti-sigma factor [Planctomycetota bacterium]